MKLLRNVFTGVAILTVVTLYAGLSFAVEKGADLPVIKWRCQSMYPPPERILPDSKYFGGYGQTMEVVRKVKEKTNGKFNIEVFIPGTLIKNPAILDGIRGGAIQMATFNGSYAGGLIKSANIEGMSVGGASDATVFVPMFLESDWMKIIRRDYAKYGIHYVCPLPTGTNLIMANFEAHTVDELKKYKIAASGAKSELLQILGVTAVNVLAMDLYPALERKTVDAIIYPSYCLNTYKFHEVVKYGIWTEIQKPQLTNIICNLAAYNALPKSYQDALNEAGMEVAIHQLKGTEEIDDVGRQTALKHGIKLITFEGAEKQKIRQAIVKIWEKYAAMSEDNAKLISILRKYAGY